MSSRSSCLGDIPSVNITASIHGDAVHGHLWQTIVLFPLLWSSSVHPSTDRLFLTIAPHPGPFYPTYALITTDSNAGHPPPCDSPRWDSITRVPHCNISRAFFRDLSMAMGYLGRERMGVCAQVSTSITSRQCFPSNPSRPSFDRDFFSILVI